MIPDPPARLVPNLHDSSFLMRTPLGSSLFVVRPISRPTAGLRLFCFPPAGAGVSAFRGWWDALTVNVEICCIRAPGRETRHRESPISDVRELADAIAAEMCGWLDRPYVVYGHSVGALIGFEVIRALRARQAPLPIRLLVGGSRAPHLPHTDPPMHALSDDEFFREVRRRYEAEPGLIPEDREMRQLIVTPLRGDFRALETYKYVAGLPLDCPISAFGGRSDPMVTRDQLDAWRSHTSTEFDLEMLLGGHIFLQTAREHLMGSISRKIAGAAGRSISGGCVAGAR
jgi:medium-chain acyl-[acyl-carrier-protein] hydrolase